MQYVNETVLEVNLPAVVPTELHVKCMGHDLETRVHAIVLLTIYFPLHGSISGQRNGEDGRIMDTIFLGCHGPKVIPCF